jgi:hypothetical protein
VSEDFGRARDERQFRKRRLRAGLRETSDQSGNLRLSANWWSFFSNRVRTSFGPIAFKRCQYQPSLFVNEATIRKSIDQPRLVFKTRSTDPPCWID